VCIMNPMRFISKYKLFITLSLGVLLLLSGCKSIELRALEDSAAILQLSTGSEVSRTVQDAETVLGKPVYAEITIQYQPLEGYTKNDVYSEVTGILEKNSWVSDERADGSDVFSASLPQGNAEILVKVWVHSNENLVGVNLVNRNH